MESKLYYECHITIEPVFEERLEQFKQICDKYRFKPAKLLMQKRAEATAERSDKDTFGTGHSKNYEDLVGRMFGLMQELKTNEFKVWRYKIEDTLLDSRHEDIFGVL